MDEYAAFAAIYEDWASRMTEDVPFYRDLVQEADGPVVELAVGNGRVAIPVAQETGKKIVGIDRSPAMLALARDWAAEAGVDLELHEGDMRDFAVDEPAALVYCPFRALLHLPTWADKRRVFERVSAALQPGGRFVWNAFVFSHKIAAANDGVWAEHAGIRHRVDHAPADNRIDITLESGDRISLWWATRSEWEGLVDTAGLETEAVYGDFERTPFTESSSEFVWVARKPD